MKNRFLLNKKIKQFHSDAVRTIINSSGFNVFFRLNLSCHEPEHIVCSTHV
jgi:hypothetical protein